MVSIKISQRGPRAGNDLKIMETAKTIIPVRAPVQVEARACWEAIIVQGLYLERALTEPRQRLVAEASAIDFENDRELFTAAADLDADIRKMLIAIRKCEKSAMRLAMKG